MQRCPCPHPHRCRNCRRPAPCHANYCSSHCYRQDAERNFRPSPDAAPPPPRPPVFTRIW